MKLVGVILILLGIYGCHSEDFYVCTCKVNGEYKSQELGYAHSRPEDSVRMECDTIKHMLSADTCTFDIQRKSIPM